MTALDMDAYRQSTPEEKIATLTYWHDQAASCIERQAADLARLTAERDAAQAIAAQAREILGRIAAATSDQGAIFLGADGRDDWDAAIAWLQKHISLTPEESMLEQHAEAINDWREFAREKDAQADAYRASNEELRAENAALREACQGALNFHDRYCDRVCPSESWARAVHRKLRAVLEHREGI